MADRHAGAPGVYVGKDETLAKVAALGLRVRNGCCYHGVSLNVDMDLSPFSAINPCGYAGMAVTQTRDLGIALTPRRPPASRSRSSRRCRSASRSGSASRPATAPARFGEIKQMLREQKLHTVCEEATCPNIGECFGKGTATFMILGDICTRRCPFCDVGHGKPLPPDADEPANSADTIAAIKLKYVVITSVDRDDLRDGGAQHFVDSSRQCASCRRAPPSKPWCPTSAAAWTSPSTSSATLPDVLNHNMETVPRLYKQARPGADYAHSLELLKAFKARVPEGADQVRPDGRPGRNRRGDPRSDARPARPRCRDADHRPVPRALRPPPAGAALRASRHLQDVRDRSEENGLHRRRLWHRWSVQATRR
jgi:hypothetical protein